MEKKLSGNMNRFLFICDNNSWEDEFSIMSTTCPLEEIEKCEKTLPLTRFRSTRDIELLRAIIECGYECKLDWGSSKRFPNIKNGEIFVYRGHSGNY